MPSNVRIDTTGMERLLREEPGKVERWLDSVAQQMVTEIVLSFGESPSSPGEPPGVDTGALRASIRWEKTARLTRQIMDGVEYGIWLEDGTPNMLPRPFMNPVFEYWRGIIEQDARRNLDLEW